MRHCSGKRPPPFLDSKRASERQGPRCISGPALDDREWAHAPLPRRAQAPLPQKSLPRPGALRRARTVRPMSKAAVRSMVKAAVQSMVNAAEGVPEIASTVPLLLDPAVQLSDPAVQLLETTASPEAPEMHAKVARRESTRTLLTSATQVTRMQSRQRLKRR